MTGSLNAPRLVDVVILDGDPLQRRILANLIARSGDRFHVHAFADRGEALAAAGRMPGAIMLVDIDTIGDLARIADLTRAVPTVIATSAAGSVHLAVAAVKAGAADFLPKPIGAKALIDRLEAALGSWRTPQAAARPAAVPQPVTAPGQDFAGFIGRSAAMAEVYAQIRRMAPSRAPVFVTGESGTGKELCAEAIHRHAGADGRPFVAINCSAIPRELMESEIFGHVRGAFTGATEDRPAPPSSPTAARCSSTRSARWTSALQAKLLRFVQTGASGASAAADSEHVDVRFVCATNRDPQAEVDAGRFRADLFYRLHVLPIHLPPLRERPDDILPLAEAFLARFGEEEGRVFTGFDVEARRCLLANPWAGNVRQLENAIRQVAVLHDGGMVDEAMLPTAIRRPASTAAARTVPAVVEPYRDQERRIIEAALATFGGSISRAAAALEISPSTIYRKRQEWSERLRA